MNVERAPEDTKFARAAALFFVVGLVLLILGAAIAGFVNRGSPDGTPLPGVVYPVFLVGIASLVAGVVAFILYVRHEGRHLKDVERKRTV